MHPSRNCSTFNYLIFKAKKLECLAEECWCISDGGNTCGYAEDDLCDPDQCWGKFDCPGYGYWCDISGNSFTLLPNYDI